MENSAINEYFPTSIGLLGNKSTHCFNQAPSKIAQQREAPKALGLLACLSPIPFITEHNTTLTLQTRTTSDKLTMQLQACTSHLPNMCHPHYTTCPFPHLQKYNARSVLSVLACHLHLCNNLQADL